MAEATAERLELADLLESLTPAQWATRSLCSRWSVRDVAAHVVSYERLGVTDLARLGARGLGSPDRMNALALAALADASPAELVRLLREHARPTGLTAGFGGGIGLTDTLVHHQDVRRPLGLPRVVPPERLRFALGFTLTAPTVRGAWHARGVRLVATDVDWSHGRGPEARGPGEAVLMALAGRAGVAADLTGPGADRLRTRLD
ncbi:maleylpyruvate isomerase family mycothiol-dependent enzyme [Nocardioides litoris]|uniref:maleylpyruvate isomerase family mycothiol-dependent enzyme n=1 Tax=Nocardioides litoris TaxID=1926648 RepID=UPI00111D35DE|nr:maleylpyruvate isomerase family mycothiol-dependent enzyme [Nocardioides litoris]